MAIGKGREGNGFTLRKQKHNLKSEDYSNLYVLSWKLPYVVVKSNMHDSAFLKQFGNPEISEISN